MSIQLLIILACWLGFLLYWLISAQSLKPTQEVKKDMGDFWGKSIGRVIVVFLFIESFRVVLIYPFTISLLPEIWWFPSLSSIIAVLGLVTAVLARKQLADNWSSDIDIKKDHELMTSGVYAYARHPIYTGVSLMCLATFLFSGTVSSLILLIAMLVFFLFKLNQEEELLTKNFPEEYPAYKKRVKALIPFIL